MVRSLPAPSSSWLTSNHQACWENYPGWRGPKPEEPVGMSDDEYEARCLLLGALLTNAAYVVRREEKNVHPREAAYDRQPKSAIDEELDGCVYLLEKLSKKLEAMPELRKLNQRVNRLPIQMAATVMGTVTKQNGTTTYSTHGLLSEAICDPVLQMLQRARALKGNFSVPKEGSDALRMCANAASILEEAGIRPTKTKTGHFVKVIRALFDLCGIAESPEHAAERAISLMDDIKRRSNQ
jgi:hypothetical protein